jgi:hypothetical protein
MSSFGDKKFVTQVLDQFARMTSIELAGQIVLTVIDEDGQLGSFLGGVQQFYRQILAEIFDIGNGYFTLVLSPDESPVFSHYIPTEGVRSDDHFRAIGRILGIIVRGGNPGGVLCEFVRLPRQAKETNSTLQPSPPPSVDDTLFFQSHEYIRRGFYDIFHTGIMSSLYPNGQYIVDMLDHIARQGYTFGLEATELIIS